MTLDRRKSDAIDALAKLAGGMEGKSETAKIREVIDSVEMALSSGVHRENVFDALRESLGIKMNFRTFETTLHRIRKERMSGNKSIISDQVSHIQKETFHYRDDNEIADSKKYFTPKRIRSIRENTLNELANDSAGNYD